MARSENLTILFTDMVDFTARTAHQSRAQNQQMLREYSRLLLPLVARCGGRRVKSIGDAFLIVFRSPTDAVRCGMAMHDAMAEYNAKEPPELRINIRVALNTGEVRLENRDVFGEAVNVAARVESITPPNELYFTEAVYLAMNKAEVPSEVVGEQTLKGIPEPVRLYRVPQRKLNRLVPAGETLNAAPGELPYGGMHRLSDETVGLQRLQRNLRVALARMTLPRWQRPTRRTGLWMGGGLLLALASLLLTLRPENIVPAAATDAPTPVSNMDDALRRLADSKAAQKLAEDAHKALAAGDRSSALRSYEQALKLDPQLSTDTRVAAGLVSGLSYASDLAMPLIRQYPSEAIFEALRKRTAEPGPRGRERAAELLRAMGQKSRIDAGGYALADLQEAQSCEQMLPAVRRLGELRERRALPQLKSYLEGGMGNWFKYRCLREDARKAIAQIEQSPRKTSGSP